MHRFNLPIFYILLSYMFGVILYDYYPYRPQSLLIGCFLFFLILCSHHWVILKKKRSIWSFSVIVALLSIHIGMFNVSLKEPFHQSAHYIHYMDSQAHTLSFEIQEQLKSTSFQHKYIVLIKRLDDKLVTGRLLLNTSKDSTKLPLSIGQHIATNAIIEDVPNPRSPYQFDYGAYLKKREIYGQIQVKTQEVLTLQQQNYSINVWAARFRESIQNRLQKQVFTSKQLSVINALLLGQRQGIDRTLNQQYADAGVIHILAVSGLHVGIILWLLRGITRPLSGYRWRHLRSICIVLCIWAFAFISGGSPSVLRAATMFSFLELGRAVGGQSNTFNTLIYSALFLLLLNPNQIYHVGFQLSYLAVMAILWIQPWLSKLYNPTYRITQLLWDTTTVTVAAQLGVLPLSLFYFHQFPGLFLVSNLVILPTLGFLLGSGIGIIILSYFQILPQSMACTYGAIIDLLNNFIAWIAAQESLVFKHLSISPLILIVSYLLILSGIHLFKKYSYLNLLIFLSGISLFIGSLMFHKITPEPPHLVIFQKTRSSLIGIYANSQLQLFSDDSQYNFNTDSNVNNYRNRLSINTICVDSLPNLFRFKRKTILRVDSLGVYALPYFQPDIILLTQSPNINLHRLIDRYPHVQIIGDGTNYRSDIVRWKTTCYKRKIPFHSTYEKGAFILK